ncbi:MAG TPA: aldo/keto reductase, partial [Pseudonocardiaceae bacterium]|jgi:aryl-alcohol dehydrogenase-like predicted oxidoreductase
MRYRLLGQTGLRVSELFLGAMSFGEHGDGGTPPAECRRIIDIYADAGGNVIDTAINYRGGLSEAVIGELIESRRDRFVIGTKYTISRNGNDPNAAGNHRKNLTLSLETSLRQLRTDYIDLYWVHLWDRHTPVEETMRALDDAIRQGKILYVGISDTPAWVISHANTLAGWHNWTPFAALQAPYNLLNRDIERELLPMAETLGITAATWSPLAHGALSATSNDDDVSESHDSRERNVIQTVQAVAKEVNATPAQVAIAWIRARSNAVHPILGSTTAEQMQENLGALDVVLPDDAIERLAAAADFTLGFPRDFIERMPPWVFGEVNNRLDGR